MEKAGSQAPTWHPRCVLPEVGALQTCRSGKATLWESSMSAAGPRRILETLTGKLHAGNLILKASGFRASCRSTWAELGPSTSQKLSPRCQPLSHPPQLQASAETDLCGPLKTKGWLQK